MWGGTACGMPWDNVMLYQKYLLGFLEIPDILVESGIFAEMFHIGSVIPNVQSLIWFHHEIFYPFKYIFKRQPWDITPFIR